MDFDQAGEASSTVYSIVEVSTHEGPLSLIPLPLKSHLLGAVSLNDVSFETPV